jgi:hypothetical protein
MNYPLIIIVVDPGKGFGPAIALAVSLRRHELHRRDGSGCTTVVLPCFPQTGIMIVSGPTTLPP